MWPQLLFDLLPHFARLLPVADKYLTTRSASDKAHEAAVGALGESLRAELGEVKEAQAGLERQLREQGEQVAEIAVDVARTRMGVESVEARIAKLEKQLSQIRGLVAVAAVLAAMALALLIARKG
jgi:septal ring factor EnvC (AmiA/AmiB activator)